MSSVEMRKRVRRTPEQARDDILDAAEALLLEEGPQGLKLVDIAKRAGVGHSLIVHHFGSIAALKGALVVRMSARMMDEVTGLIEEADFAGGVASEITKKIFAIYGRAENAKLIAWLVLSNEVDRRSELAAQSRKISQLIKAQMERSGRGDMATPAFLAGLQSISIMAALGEALGRHVLAQEVIANLPETQTQEWITELMLIKLNVLDGHEP